MKLPTMTAEQALGRATQVYPNPTRLSVLAPASVPRAEDRTLVGHRTPGEIAADVRAQLLVWGQGPNCFPSPYGTNYYGTGWHGPGQGNPVIYQSEVATLRNSLWDSVQTNCGRVTRLGGHGGQLVTSRTHGQAGVIDAIYRPDRHAPNSHNNFVYHIIVVPDPEPDLSKMDFPALSSPKKPPGSGKGSGGGSGNPVLAN